MPCRALEAFGRIDRGRGRCSFPEVLMPCRALEAFGPRVLSLSIQAPTTSLNALSGIGGVRTKAKLQPLLRQQLGLNALSGIGGVRTMFGGFLSITLTFVLMPCRALEAFGPR